MKTDNNKNPAKVKDTIDRNTVLAALEYLGRGWSIVVVAYKDKNPVFSNWNKKRMTQEEITRELNNNKRNLGIALGEMSGDIVDVDLDSPIARKLAERILPKTATFGREGSLKSHYLYICKGTKTQQFANPQVI